MLTKTEQLRHSQTGAAALITTVLLLIGVTFIVIFATRMGILDQRISGNEVRHKQAFASAEAGLEQAAAYLRANPQLHEGNVADGWATCTGNEAIFPCDIAGATQVFGTVGGGTITTNIDQIAALTDSTSHLVKTATSTVAVGVGTSDDATGNAIAQIAYARTSLLIPGSVPPLMVPAGNLSGNFNIVPNPNGGGPGVPISVWAKTTLDTSGANWKTCHMGEFKDNSGNICMDTKGDGVTGDDWAACSCDAEISNSGNVDSDIVLYPASEFPPSPFAYIFGEPDDDFATLKAEVKARAMAQGLYLPNCDNLVSGFSALTGSALVWIEGDCAIGSNINVGSRDKPVILVVEGDIRVNAAAEFWGLVVGLADFDLNGGPVIHGSAVSEIPSDLTNGNYSQVYDESVFQQLYDDTINVDISKIAYSWRDFNP